MPLQADPTVVFAWKDFTIKRVTSKYTALNSPYNTYQNTGLPPGPISIVSGDVIDRVLKLEHHDYLYFCAKADFSENHAFAVTYAEHRENAVNYQKALDKRKNEASDVAKPFLNKEILVALIDVASKSQFDDSPLVMKQKIRKLIKSRIRKEA